MGLGEEVHPGDGLPSTSHSQEIPHKGLAYYVSIFTKKDEEEKGREATAEVARNQDGEVSPRIQMFRKAVERVQVRRRMASFFGVDEASEAEEKILWQGRRYRLATRRYGHLKPIYTPSSTIASDGTRHEMSDIGEESSVKPSVAKMTLSGVSNIVANLKRRSDHTSRAQYYTGTEQAGRGSHAEITPLSTKEHGAWDSTPRTQRGMGMSLPSTTSELEDDVFAPSPQAEKGTFEFGPVTLAYTHPNKKKLWDRVKQRTTSNSSHFKKGRRFLSKFFSGSDIRRKPLDSGENMDDHRPFFTYWVTTVQILILLISIVCYGFGPIGLSTLHQTSGLVLTGSLSLQQVNYEEPTNFYYGPRAADLIHLGAKFAPCMRRDEKITNEIQIVLEKERNSACCIRNDESGCIQALEEECSEMISTWKKWSGVDISNGRTSGTVCGQDPKWCEVPASVGAYEWEDDITKWPICSKRSEVGGHEGEGTEHMVCEMIGHPCCIGIHASCSITTKEYCDFVHGNFHEEAHLCSQVSCLNDVCGMVPFWNPDVPDQFYRLFTSLFLHAGVAHLMVTIAVQMFLMRDLEKFTGTLRIMIIYFGSGIGGNLASAVFLPYRADVGPTASQFGLLACLIAEVLNMWRMLVSPWKALTKLLCLTLFLLVIGLLPWVDNFSHIFGLVFGFLLAFPLLPFNSLGDYDRSKKIKEIWICLFSALAIFICLVVLFYVKPLYDCPICDIINCIPITPDFCANQNINFKRSKSLL